MIIVRLIGGLGNQMFQYAAGRSLAKHHNTELKLDITRFNKIKNITPRKYYLSHMRINEIFATDDDLNHVTKFTFRIKKKFFFEIYRVFKWDPPIFVEKEPYFQFYPDFFALTDNVYLEGYWQSERYFKPIENEIRSEFVLKEKPDLPNALMAEEILKSNAVSIHIRRGDYLSNPITFDYHGVCSLEYYYTAINLIAKKISDTHFYIFSDDPKWVQQNLKLNFPHTHVTHNQESKDYMDLWLMSLCKHHIIANSSFSWWGAWLSNNKDKIVIAPKNWFNQPDIDTKDLIPDSWYQV